MLETGEVVGETKKMLQADKIPYKIPYPVAMDSLIKQSGEVTKEKMDSLIKNQIPNFDEQAEDYKNQIYDRVKDYFMSKEFSAETFEMYSLQGTPSSILVDRKGILRDISFGQNGLGYAVFFGFFGCLFYLDNKKRYQAMKPKLIKKELIKLASSFGIGEIVYLGIRWSLMFYFLEIEIEPFAASLVSEAIATTFYLAVVSTVLKVTKAY